MQPVFRFAPSPNGYLHLGHAYSALLNQALCQRVAGRMLLRIEDIDTIRCRPELIRATLEDLRWIGFAWEEPVLHQSTRFPAYQEALARLDRRGLLYPCFCSRKDILGARLIHCSDGGAGPCDPDGAPIYPGTCRRLDPSQSAQRLAAGEPHALRIDMARALAISGGQQLTWQEHGKGTVVAEPAIWGDVIVARKELATSYHLSVVLDDDLQGVTHVVRGQDLYQSTAVHRLLQRLLGLAEPVYRHHDLIRDGEGGKLAKSRYSTPLRQLRAEGLSAMDIRQQLMDSMSLA